MQTLHVDISKWWALDGIFFYNILYSFWSQQYVDEIFVNICKSLLDTPYNIYQQTHSNSTMQALMLIINKCLDKFQIKIFNIIFFFCFKSLRIFVVKEKFNKSNSSKKKLKVRSHKNDFLLLDIRDYLLYHLFK